MAKKKSDWTETWWGSLLIIGGLFGGAFFIGWLSRAKNPLSPIISIIGVVGVVIGGYFLYKLLKKSSTEHTQNKNKIKNISIAISVCAIMAIVGMCSMTMELPSFSEREKVVKNISINGIDENSVPLAVSDFKMLKKGNTYTLLGTLKKTSKEPEQSYFKFDVAMIDKNGKHIKEDTVDTMPYPFLGRENMPLFTYESSCHLEKEIYLSSSAPAPVSIEITNIQEYDKANFIRVILDDAREHMSKGYNDDAKQLLDKLFEYDLDNEEAKILLAQLSDPNYTPAPSAQSEKDVLIGTSKDNVRRLLSQYKETKSIMSSNALDFEDNNLLITVYFNSDDIADGVLFMQNSFDGVDTLTGVGSYVSKHYDELVSLATDDPNVKIESDLTLYNSQGKKKEAMELYIGNVPNGNPQSQTSNNGEVAYKLNDETGEWEKTTGNSNTTKTEKAEVEPEFKEVVFLNVGMKVYQYKSNDSYLGTIKIVDRDYRDERGKKVGAVYLEGGATNGWYKRADIVRCYVRSDDPLGKTQY